MDDLTEMTSFEGLSNMLENEDSTALYKMTLSVSSEKNREISGFEDFIGSLAKNSLNPEFYKNVGIMYSIFSFKNSI